MTFTVAMITPVSPVAVLVRVSSPLAVVAIRSVGRPMWNGQGQEWGRMWARFCGLAVDIMFLL